MLFMAEKTSLFSPPLHNSLIYNFYDPANKFLSNFYRIRSLQVLFKLHLANQTEEKIARKVQRKVMMMMTNQINLWIGKLTSFMEN